MTLDTVFWIASMTKAVTATACMQLVEQGKLQLDQPMGELLPELPQPQVLEGFDASGAPQAAAGQAADHAAAPADPHRRLHLQHLERADAPVREGDRHARSSARARPRRCIAPLMFDPGERWEYGINIDWVGKAVEKVSGQSLEVYFREHIFEPLGMTDTGFLIGSAQKARVATMYNRERGRLARADAVRDAAGARSSSWAAAPCSARRATTWRFCRCC